MVTPSFCPGRFTPVVEVVSASSLEPVFDETVLEPCDPTPLPDTDSVVSVCQSPSPCGVSFSNAVSTPVPAIPSCEDIMVETENQRTKVKMLDLLSCPCFLQVLHVLAVNGFDGRLCSRISKREHLCNKCHWCTAIAGNSPNSLRLSQEQTRHPSAFSLPKWRNVPPRHPRFPSRILLSGRLELNSWYLAYSRLGDPPPYTSNSQSSTSYPSDDRHYPPDDSGCVVERPCLL